MVLSNVDEFGRLLSQSIKNTERYKETFISTEETFDLNTVGVEIVKTTMAHKIDYKYVVNCSVTGVNSSTDPFVLDHPVNGNLDSSSFYIDGDYCSSSTIYDDTTSL